MKNQKISVDYKLKNSEDAKIVKKTFFWTPKNKNAGENKVTFYVTDGITNDSTTTTVNVDTLKKQIINDKIPPI